MPRPILISRLAAPSARPHRSHTACPPPEPPHAERLDPGMIDCALLYRAPRAAAPYSRLFIPVSGMRESAPPSRAIRAQAAHCFRARKATPAAARSGAAAPVASPWPERRHRTRRRTGLRRARPAFTRADSLAAIAPRAPIPASSCVVRDRLDATRRFASAHVPRDRRRVLPTRVKALPSPRPASAARARVKGPITS